MCSALLSHAAFAERLQTCIEKAGGKVKFSSAAGVHRNTISGYLKKYEPDRKVLIDLAQAAGVSPEWLATGFEPGHQQKDLPSMAPALPDGSLAAYKQRLGELIKKAGGVEQLAATAGFSKPRLLEILAGLTMHAFEVVRVCEALEVSADWLLLGKKPGNNIAPVTDSSHLTDFEGVNDLMPKWDPKGTLTVTMEFAKVIALNRQWAIESLECAPNDLLHLIAPDTHMEPLIRKGASILINRIAPITGDGIYVFRMGDQFLVRKLQFFASDVAQVRAMTDDYRVWSLKDPRMNTEVSFFGKVVWWSQQS